MRTREAIGVERVEEEVGIDLALQSIKSSFEHQALLLFERHLDAQGIPHLNGDSDRDRRAQPDQRLQPEFAGEQRKQAMRKGVSDPVASHLHHRNQNQEEELAVDARLDQVAANPAVEAEVDEGRKRPDLFLLHKAADHAGSEAQNNVERQREIFVVQNGGDRQHTPAEHGPARPDEQAEQNHGFKRDVGGKKVGNPKPKPNPERKRHQEKSQQSQSLPMTPLLGKKQAPESGHARQHAGHRGHYAQLHQQRDPDKVVGHTINVPQ